MTGSYTLSFREAAQVVENSGEKAASLGRLASAGFRVPAGFILSAAAYQDFARAAGITRETHRFEATHRDPHTESALYDMARLRLACLRATLPETLRSAIISALAQSGIFGLPLAVRPSVACDEPTEARLEGLHRAALNVLGFEALEAAVRNCWAGLWLPDSVAGRRQMGVRDSSVSVAVIIQRLVPADAAGLAFTRDPESGGDAVVIRAAWGLGEGVTSGRVEPDAFMLCPDTAGPILVRADAGSKAEIARPAVRGGICWQTPSPDQRRRLSLSAEQATAIAETCRRIEQALGGPQAVEWTRVGDDISLLQTRPLVAPAPPGAGGSLAAVDEPATPPWGTSEWSHAPLSQALPYPPTPLTWSLAQLLLERTLRQLLEGTGCSIPPGATIARGILGRPSLDLSAVQWILGDAFGMEPEMARRVAGAEPGDGGRSAPAPPRPLPLRWRWLRGALSRWRASLTAGSCLRRTTRRLNSLERHAPGLQPDLELLEAHLDNAETALGYLPYAALTLLRSSEALLHLEGILRHRLGPDYLPGRAADLLTLRRSTLGVQAGAALDRLAAAAAADPEVRTLLLGYGASPEDGGSIPPDTADGQPPLSGTRAGEMLTQFLHRYGHHALVDLEVMQPRWSEDARHPLQIAARSLAGAPMARGNRREGSPAAWTGIRRRLGLWDRVRCRRAVSTIRKGLVTQEAAGSLLTRQAALERRICLEAGLRLAASGLLERPADVFFLKAAELRALLLGEDLGSDMRTLIGRRRREHEAYSRPPEHAAGGPAGAAGTPPAPEADAPADRRLLTGIGVSGGSVVGQARVLRGADECPDIGPGDILVTEWVGLARAPHLLRAGGLVLGGGGPLSQGAVLAREAGIPAVAGLHDATGRIPDGARISLDGDRGLVELLI